MKLSYILAFAMTPALFAQTPTPATPTEVTVKSSPAEDALVKAAKEAASSQRAYDTLLQQARSGLESNQKDIAKQLTDVQNDLNAKLKEDKKYKPLVDKIIALQQQLSDASKTAQNNFSQQSGPLQQQLNTDNALIKGLIPVVRQENGLPETVKFDSNTQKWTK